MYDDFKQRERYFVLDKFWVKCQEAPSCSWIPTVPEGGEREKSEQFYKYMEKKSESIQNIFTEVSG